MARAATTADVFNAVAETHRRDILVVLAGGEAAVGDLVERLRLTQPQVSKHLGVLRAVDLVRSRPVGRRHLYRVNAPALRPVHDWVSRFEAQWNERLDRLDDLLAELHQPDLNPPNVNPPNVNRTEKNR
jgi:DNA-binding transcriptional ArsR family regulator